MEEERSYDVHDPETGCIADKAWTSTARDAPLAPTGPPKPAKQSCPASPTCADYADAGWRSLDVPHDFVVEGTFAPNASENHGFLPFDIGWSAQHPLLHLADQQTSCYVSRYRKSFEVDASAEGKVWVWGAASVLLLFSVFRGGCGAGPLAHRGPRPTHVPPLLSSPAAASAPPARHGRPGRPSTQ